MKRALRIGLAVVVILFLLGAGARWYLTSRPLANKVTAQLAELYGGDVKLEGVDVWVGSSSLTGIQLFEKDCPSQAEPWLSVLEISTDLSVFNLVGGTHTPNQIKLDGAKVLLRFDKAGKLITCLPEKLFPASGPDKSARVDSLPEVELRNSQITLRKGDSDLVLDNINAKLVRESDRFVLSGSVHSSKWGKWDLAGSAPVGATRVDVSLKSQEAVPVTQPMLDQIPFVPPGVWKEIQISQGETPGLLKFTYDLSEGKLHYRVELEPRKTDFTVPSVELKASNAQGKLTVEDGLVELRNVSGQVFNGTLHTDADLDFRSEVTVLRFDPIEAVKGAGPRVEQLPRSWKFPPKITGRMEGTARVEVEVYPETPTSKFRIQTKGAGKGSIADAKIGRYAPTEPPTWQLNPVPGGFGFGVKGNETSWHPPINQETFAGLLLAGTMLSPPENAASTLLPQELASIAKAFLAVAQDKDKPTEKEAPKKDTEKNSYFDIELKMKDLDLVKFAQDIEFKLPFELAGKVSFQVKISIPVDKTGDLKLYKVHGTAQLSDFTLGDLKLEYLETEVAFTEGILRMPQLKGRMPSDPTFKEKTPGTFAGQGTFQVEPLGDLKVSLTLERVPLSQVAKLSGSVEPVQGDISGTMEALVPGKDFKNPKAWTADAKLSSRRVLAFGWSLEDASALARLAKGNLTLDRFNARLEGATITASAQIALDGAFPFSGKATLQNADLAALQRLTPKWRPPYKVAGRLQTATTFDGTINPLKVNASGMSEASDLQVDQFSFKNAQVTWQLEPGRLNLKEVQARLYDGELSGSAFLPLDSRTAGSVNLQVKGLDAGALAKSIPAMPIKIQGKVDGIVNGTLPPTKEGKERAVSVSLDLKAPKLRVQNIPTEQLQGAVEYKEGVLDYQLEGKSLGGTFELKGQIPRANEEEKKPAKKGRLEINRIQINRLLDALGMGDGARAYQGSVSVELNYTHDPEETWPEGSGRVRISNLRYKDILLAADVVGDIVLRDQRLRLREFSTTFGEGIIRAQANLNLRRFDLSWFTISMDRVEVSQLLGPWLGDTVKGHLQARIRGKLGSEWSGTADLEMARAQVAGLEVSQWRLPIHFRYAPSEGRGQLEVHETNAQVGAGRITGKFNYGWDYASRIEGQLRFYRINVETLLRETLGPTRLAGGLATGRFDFAGRDMRSINDLTGTFVASFDQAQALNIPVLRQVSPFLGLNPSTTFQKGDIHARLAGGVFRIAGFGLEGNTASLFIAGNVALSGRLDLDVQATTGNLGLDPRLRLLGVRIPVGAPVPLLLAQEAATLLSNRVIHLRVTGTIRSPTIRVLPLAALTQEGIRYFLTRSFGPLPFSP